MPGLQSCDVLIIAQPQSRRRPTAASRAAYILRRAHHRAEASKRRWPSAFWRWRARRASRSACTARRAAEGQADLVFRGAWGCGATGRAPAVEKRRDWSAQVLSIETLVNTVQPHVGTGLRLIVLTGCCTNCLGEQLRKAGVPDVVCWETVVEDEAGKVFGEAFAKATALQVGEIDPAAAFKKRAQQSHR